MHPEELAEQREFREAVELLKPDTVALETVLQYATGRELGARLRRHRRAEGARRRRAGHGAGGGAFRQALPLAHVLRAQVFRRRQQPRPPVGAPFAGAKDWWCDNPVLPTLFRDYLAERERLGDAPVFGQWAPPVAASAPREGLSGARAPPLRDGADRRAAAAPANHARSRLPRPRSDASGRRRRTSTRSSSPSPGGRVWRPRRPPRWRRLRARCWRRATPGSARPRSCGCWPSAWSATGGSCSRRAAPT